MVVLEGFDHLCAAVAPAAGLRHHELVLWGGDFPYFPSANLLGVGSFCRLPAGFDVDSERSPSSARLLGPFMEVEDGPR